mgnify:CR=1 FL=1
MRKVIISLSLILKARFLLFFLELRFNLLTEFVDRIKDFRYLGSVISVHVGW